MAQNAASKDPKEDGTVAEREAILAGKQEELYLTLSTPGGRLERIVCCGLAVD